jgi:chemotaxis protein MotB
MSGNRPVVIKKVKKVIGGGHHGGAWKVAYADFVTAMMAFFLLMWLINTTSPEQKRGIADYFAPASVSRSPSRKMARGLLVRTARSTRSFRRTRSGPSPAPGSMAKACR